MDNVEVWSALVIACASLAFGALGMAIWLRICQRIQKARPCQLVPTVLTATARSLPVLLLMAGLRWSLWFFEQIEDFEYSSWLKMPENVLFVGMVIGFCMLAGQFLGSLLEWYRLNVAHRTKTTLDNDFIPLFRKLSKIVIFFAGTMLILSRFKVPVTGFVATAGVASLAVALAAKETLANMISGFLILIDRPFRINDRIEMSDGQIGDVQEIGLRCTKILTFDNTILVIPNSDISAARVINHGYPNAKVKMRLRIGVAYGSDMNKVKEILVDIARKSQRIMDEPAPAAYFMSFGDSALKVMLIAWVADYREKFSITDEVNLAIQERFAEAGIGIPFPQQDVHLYQKS